MRFNFWKKDTQNIAASDKPDRGADVGGAKQIRLPNYPVLPIKAWTDRRLTPVAWARILVRLLPILQEYGYSLREIQNPSKETYVDESIYVLFQATILELYNIRVGFRRKNRAA